jgi:hypothetical protein
VSAVIFAIESIHAILAFGVQRPYAPFCPVASDGMKTRRDFVSASFQMLVMAGLGRLSRSPAAPSDQDKYRFDGRISRPVLEAFLSRAITMEGLLSRRGDFDDNLRMLKLLEAKYIGRSICLWGGEAHLLENLANARLNFPKVREIGQDSVFEACIFEIVTHDVNLVPIPAWVFAGWGLPIEHRTFRYEAMLYPQGTRVDQWGQGASVPDVSQTETKLWFYFLAASYIDIGFEAIHFGQVGIMNGNDPTLTHWAQVFALVRKYAMLHARRHMVLCNAHVPGGGFVKDGKLLLDFHAFPLRIVEVPSRPREGVLKLGFADSIYGRSKGGITYSGWSCRHLPYLVELDNYGISHNPGKAGQGLYWVWGYDEISWFAGQTQEYRAAWLRYACNWLRSTDPNGFLEMPGNRTLSLSPRLTWYSANSPSSAVPNGSGDEQAIREIWFTTKQIQTHDEDPSQR